ncbi:MAG: hypothetical protein JXR48_15005 [Candidatus Delongbacteria bacterium]|nr:hypothetical protein [Candidatus Delongbacteria bacterium]MBN2836265.1 hypothetical protein [Candidatus Delongbacteria bacterium]
MLSVYKPNLLLQNLKAVLILTAAFLKVLLKLPDPLEKIPERVYRGSEKTISELQRIYWWNNLKVVSGTYQDTCLNRCCVLQPSKYPEVNRL